MNAHAAVWRKAGMAASLAMLVGAPLMSLAEAWWEPRKALFIAPPQSRTPEAFVALLLLCGGLLAYPFIACLYSAPVSRRSRLALLTVLSLLLIGLTLIEKQPGIIWTSAVRLFGPEAGAYRSLTPLLVFLGCSGLAAVGFRKDPLRVLAAVETILLILLPFGALRMATGIYRLWPQQEAEAVSRPANPASRASGKVVVLVLDEMDGELAFSSRPPTLEMPAFDELARSSWRFAAAYPPSDYTIFSMAAYTTGRMVERFDHGPGATLQYAAAGESLRPWREQASLFHAAHRSGRPATVHGWFLPYCRSLGGLTAACSDLPSPTAFPEHGIRSMLESSAPTRRLEILARFQAFELLTFARNLKAIDPVLEAETWEFARGHFQRELPRLLEGAYRAIGSGAPGLHLVHVPVPHPPNLNESGSPALPGYARSYINADEVLRQTMESLRGSGAWEESTLIVTSDHSLRSFWAGTPLGAEVKSLAGASTYSTVPLLVKMPHQTAGGVIAHPVNSLILHRLALEAMARRSLEPDAFLKTVDDYRRTQPLKHTGQPFPFE